MCILQQVHSSHTTNQVRKAQKQQTGVVHHSLGVADIGRHRCAHSPRSQRHSRQELRRMPLQQPELCHLLFFGLILHTLYNDDVPLL